MLPPLQAPAAVFCGQSCFYYTYLRLRPLLQIARGQYNSRVAPCSCLPLNNRLLPSDIGAAARVSAAARGSRALRRVLPDRLRIACGLCCLRWGCLLRCVNIMCNGCRGCLIYKRAAAARGSSFIGYVSAFNLPVG